MRSSGEPRLLLQALIQVAAAFVHLEAGRARPALRLVAAASVKLAGLPSPLLGLDPVALRARLGPVAAALADGTAAAVPAIPELGFSGRPGDPPR